MVLVAVGEEDGFQSARGFREEVEVGNDVIDPRVHLIREHKPRVDHDRLAFVLQQGHVLTDFA